MSFKIGDKVVCIEDLSCLDGGGPKDNQILAVSVFTVYSIANQMVGFKKWRSSLYNSCYFRKPTTDEMSQEKLIEEARELVKEKELILI